jgi:hypothetical protein
MCSFAGVLFLSLRQVQKKCQDGATFTEAQAMNDSCKEQGDDSATLPSGDSAAAQMWIRIAGAIEREAERCPPGQDRDLALEWAHQLRRRLKPRQLP